MRFRKPFLRGTLCLALVMSMLLTSCASVTGGAGAVGLDAGAGRSVEPGTGGSGNLIGQGKLGGDADNSAGKSRYNTTQIRPEEGDTDYDRLNVPDLGETRLASIESTRRMYEYVSASKTLIIHGYGSVIGSAQSMEQSYLTPGTIGGGALEAHRKSWLDGYYPYIWDGKVNGPEGTDPGPEPAVPDKPELPVKPERPDGADDAAMSGYDAAMNAYNAAMDDYRNLVKEYDAARNVLIQWQKDSAYEDIYTSHEALSVEDIKYIIIDDLTTMIKDDMGLKADRDHSSYGTSEDDYVSGITEIAPYAFANLYALEAIDFDATQIRTIGDYAFAGCENLGKSAIPKETAEVRYEDNGTGYIGADGEGSRKYYNHDYKKEGCALDCEGDCVDDLELYYKEMEGRVSLPHGLVSLGEHVFQNCPNIREYMIHEDNTYFIASAGRDRWQAAGKSDWDVFTDGVVYSSGTATSDGLKETAYTRLRAAVMSDYRAVPEAYAKFWVGPFGETEPMPLEWYVKSWNVKDHTSKLGVTAACPYDHFNWTEVEAAVNKAKAASGNVGKGNRVETADESWKTAWVDYLPTKEDAKFENYKYNENWWDNEFFNMPVSAGGAGRYGYDRKNYGGSLSEAKTMFDRYIAGGSSNDFNTLYLYPEGKPGAFFIWPGHDPGQWESEKKTATSEVVVIAPFAFSNAEGLTSIDMSACCELTTFGQGAFMNCPSLTTVIFPEAGCTTGSGELNASGRQPNYKLTKLSDDMFSQCVKLSEIYNLDRDYGPTGGLGNMQYNGDDDHLKPGNARSTVQEFGQNCFHKCLSLTAESFKSGSTVDGTGGTGLPDTLLIIGQSCFHTCKNLSSLRIHKNIEVIGDYAFSDCYSLSSLTFEDKTADDNGYLSGPAMDRIPDTRNGTNENKQRQFYISSGNSEGSPPLAVQFGSKTFEHCTALTSLTVGSIWLIQKSTFEHDIYLLEINMISEKGNPYTVNKYDFNNGNTGQDKQSPDRASNGSSPVTDDEYFKDCAYTKRLHDEGTRWYKND